MMSVSMKERQRQKIDPSTQPWFLPLQKIVGKENIITRFSEKLAYGRDRWPRSNLKYRFGKFPLTDPYLVVVPWSYDEVIELVKFANLYKIPIVPYALGSGGVGGALPVPNGITIDLKRLNKLLEIDEVGWSGDSSGGYERRSF